MSEKNTESLVGEPTKTEQFFAHIHLQLQTHSKRIAVEDGATSYSYQRLATDVAAVANRLKAIELPPQSIVGILTERSYAYIVSALGTAFAGHTFLPLDPSYPAERLAFMLKDSGAGAILVDGTHANVSPAIEQLPLLEVRPCADPGQRAVPVPPAGFVYAIYTSGTTGQPKAISIHSTALQNFLSVQGRALAVNSESRFITLSSISFDMSIWEIFMPLYHGARLRILPRGTTIEGQLIGRALLDARTTHILATPTLLSLLPAMDLPHLRHVVSAGEACPPGLVRSWSERAEFYDAYGATEATIYTTLTRKTPDLPANDVGVAMDGTRIIVVDDTGRPVTPGSIGEICIAGVGVHAGYLNREDLNARKFQTINGEPAYLTGDLGVLSAAGRLLFHGRRDRQVKIRGYRVELEEIEMAISRLSGVRSTHVAIHRSRVGLETLVAFITAGDDGPKTARDVRLALLSTLPSQMVPSRVCFVDSLPTTVTGKVDTTELLSRLKGAEK